MNEKLNREFKMNIKKLEMNREFYKGNTIEEREVLEFKNRIGKNYNERRILTSPYADALDIIISGKDFVKKQQEIITFSQNFCRDYNFANDENKYWLYRNSTDVKLMPVFLVKLANAYFQDRDTTRNWI